MMTITIVLMLSLMQTDTRLRMLHTHTHWLAALVLTLLLTGCAATSTTILDEEVVNNQKHMASYKSLIIRNFELKSDLYTTSPVSKLTEQEIRYAQIPDQFAENILRYVKSRNIYQSVSRTGQPSETTLVLKGRFMRVGRFRISIIGTLHDGANDQEVAYFRQTLWDIFDTTETVNLLSREVADFIDRIQYK